MRPREWSEAVKWSAQQDGWSGWDFDHLFKLCQNLVDVDGQFGVVRFAHLSVREFLVEKDLEGEGHRIMAEWCAAIIEWQYYGGDQHILSVRERMRYALSNWGTHMLKGPRKDTDGYPYSVYMLVLRERGHHWTHLDSQFPFYMLYSDEGKWYWMKPHISNCHYLFIFAFLGIHATGRYWPHNAATLIDSAGLSLFESAIK